MAGSITVSLAINNAVTDTETVQVAAQTGVDVNFTTVSEANTGTYMVSVQPTAGTITSSTLTGNFTVVPTGYHTLIVVAGPISGSGVAKGVTVTIDGKTYPVPYDELLPVGTYTITVPITDPTGTYTFYCWDDGSSSPTRTIDLDQLVIATAYYSGAGSSCPTLYVWNGTAYTYVSDVSNHGWLGYIDSIDSNGTINFYKNDPWDYVPLNSSQLQPTDGYFNLTMMEQYNEVFYLDQAYMVAVDHPVGTSVYSTMVEQFLDPNYMGNIYTINDSTVQSPISAVNQDGQNVLPEISKMDNVFTPGLNGLLSPSWNNITWNTLTLNLGNLTGAQQIKLVVRAIVNWGTPQEYSNWVNEFFAQPVPNGTQVTPPSFMEVKDANGNWIQVPQGREFPLPSDGAPRTYVVDLTGLFPTNDYELKICNFWNVTFDYIGVDTSPQQNIIIQKINPQAYLYQAFIDDNSTPSGDFTRYGNVTQLVQSGNDMFVIGREGDAVSLQFPISQLAPVPQGMVRDYFLFEACWFKDQNGNWGFGFPFTVDPLPFENMTSFPYPPNESYPNDTAHQNYLQEWDTRIIPPTNDAQSTSSFVNANALILLAVPTVLSTSAVFVAYACLNCGSLYRFRLRKLII